MEKADPHLLARWRLVLGKAAEAHCITCGGEGDAQRIEDLVGFLFEPGSGGAGGGQSGRGSGGGRQGGRGAPVLTIPDWVDQVRELFPQQAKEVLEREL